MHAGWLLGKPVRRQAGRGGCLFLPLQDVLSKGAKVSVEGGSATGLQGDTLLTLQDSVSPSVKRDEENPPRRHTVVVHAFGHVLSHSRGRVGIGRRGAAG